jgi:hypothetical protein
MPQDEKMQIELMSRVERLQAERTKTLALRATESAGSPAHKILTNSVKNKNATIAELKAQLASSLKIHDKLTP